MPSVSIVVPAFNASRTLAETLQSLSSQQYEDWEGIVVDDGSTPDHNYEAACDIDHRIRLIHQRNGGPSIARNLGILTSDSRYIAFLDSDDLWESTKLRQQIELLDRHPEFNLCFTDFSRSEDAQGTESSLRNYRKRTPGYEFHDLLHENFVATSSVVVRREALALTGLFNPDLMGPEDLDLWLRFARLGEFGFIDSVLVRKRDHKENLSSSLVFTRNHVKMLNLWLKIAENDALAKRVIRRSLRQVHFHRAYGAQTNGLLRESRSAYFASARMGYRPIDCIIRGFILSLPEKAARLAFRIAHQWHNLFAPEQL